MRRCFAYSIFFFNDTATTEIYTLSLHDALPICMIGQAGKLLARGLSDQGELQVQWKTDTGMVGCRSEEHTSELQSQSNLVCRLLLEKKKKRYSRYYNKHDIKSEWAMISRRVALC